MKNKACSAFQLDDPVEAFEHIRQGRKIIKNYGDRYGSNYLHTWDEGNRILYQCTLCGGFILGQFSEFHGVEDDDYYTDYFPVDGPEDAERINAEYDGERIEEKFPEKWMIADVGNPHWREGYNESRKPQGSDYDPEKPLKREQLPQFTTYMPYKDTVARTKGALTDEWLSFSEKLHNQLVQKLIGKCKTDGQLADQIALLMAINGSKLLVLEKKGATGFDQSSRSSHIWKNGGDIFCFATGNEEQYLGAFTQEDQIPKLLRSFAVLSKYSLVDLVKACKAFKSPFEGIVINKYEEEQGWVLTPADVQIALYAYPLSGAEPEPGYSIDEFRKRKAALIEDCRSKQETIQARIAEAKKTNTDNAGQVLLLHGTLRYLNARRSVLEETDCESDN